MEYFGAGVTLGLCRTSPPSGRKLVDLLWAHGVLWVSLIRLATYSGAWPVQLRPYAAEQRSARHKSEPGQRPHRPAWSTDRRQHHQHADTDHPPGNQMAEASRHRRVLLLQGRDLHAERVLLPLKSWLGLRRPSYKSVSQERRCPALAPRRCCQTPSGTGGAYPTLRGRSYFHGQGSDDNRWGRGR